MMKKAGRLLLGCLAVLLILASPANCTIYQASEDPLLFGNLSQHDPTLVTAYDQDASGPTSAVNAFVYLQRQYPTIYGTTLVPAYDTATLAASALKLGGFNYMSILTPIQIYGLSNGVTSSVFLKDKYAYVGSNGGSHALKIFDITNPAAPTLVGSTGGSGIGNINVICVDNYAFVGWNNSTIRIYDISNPSSPTQISSITYNYGNTKVLNVIGNLLYVGTTSGADYEFRIYDISNIYSPSLVSVTNIGADVNAISVVGNYAYLGTDAQHSYFQIYDISNPAAPSIISSLDVGPVTNTVYIDGKYAYLGLNNGPTRFQIYDISDPTTPTLVAAVATPTQVNDLVVAGNYAYLAMGGRNSYPALSIYDVTNPKSPIFVAKSENSTDVSSVVIDGKYAYLGTSTGNPTSFRVYDLHHLYHRDYIWGITAYVRSKNTGYAGQMTDPGIYDTSSNPGGWGWNGRVRPLWIGQNASYPTWNFIYDSLISRRAVQIAWRGQDAGGNIYRHYLTVTGLDFNDINNSGIIKFKENATISYIDPKDGKAYSAHIWQDNSDNLFLYYHNDTYDWFSGNVQLEMVMSEGPSSATAPFLLLLLGD
jgi:hypothetical protein